MKRKTKRTNKRNYRKSYNKKRYNKKRYNKKTYKKKTYKKKSYKKKSYKKNKYYGGADAAADADADAAAAAAAAAAATKEKEMKPPEGPCRKQKPTATLLWPERYARIEGKALNFYDKAGDAEPRGSSIPDVTGCAIGVPEEKEKFTFDGEQYVITLTRKNHPNGLPNLFPPLGTEPDGIVRFCFKKEAERDKFVVALRHMVDGKRWDGTESEPIDSITGSIIDYGKAAKRVSKREAREAKGEAKGEAMREAKGVAVEDSLANLYDEESKLLHRLSPERQPVDGEEEIGADDIHKRLKIIRKNIKRLQGPLSSDVYDESYEDDLDGPLDMTPGHDSFYLNRDHLMHPDVPKEVWRGERSAQIVDNSADR